MNPAYFTFAFVLLLSFQSLWGQSNDKAIEEFHEFIVVIENGYTQSNLSEALYEIRNNDLAFDIVRQIVPDREYYLIKGNRKSNYHQLNAKLLSYPQIRSIYPNLKVNYRETIPDDTFYQNFQWALDKIGAPNVWDESTGGLSPDGDTIVVAVIDSGFEADHEDLKDNVWRNIAEIPNDAIDNDGNGYIDDYLGINIQDQNDEHPVSYHGTAVAGIIGAKGNNQLGISGVNWNIKLMLVSNVQFIDEIIEAYYYVLKFRQKYNASEGAEGAYVVATNFSAGIDKQWGFDFPLWCSVYDSLGMAGILNVSSTTNENYNIDVEGDMPSTCESQYLIVVNNTNLFDNKAISTGYGKIHVDLGAPGSGTFSLDVQDGYNGFDGTSGSAPHVSGAIGLLHSIPCQSFSQAMKSNPAETTLELRKAILDNVVPLSDLDTITSSGGRLSILNSLQGLQNYCLLETGELAFFPQTNPSRTNFNSSYQSPDFEDYALKVFSSSGKLVYKDILKVPRFSEKFISIDTRNFGAGMYFIVLHRGKTKIVQKFIVH